MQGLLPIIRRQRRPLVVVDAPPVVVANVEPVNAEAGRAKFAEHVATIGHLGEASLPVAIKEAD